MAHIMSRGATPAGTHRPIAVQEILDALNPQPGQVVVDCTLGYGGHASELLRRVLPGGRLFAFDVDPIELPKAEARLRRIVAESLVERGGDDSGGAHSRSGGVEGAEGASAEAESAAEASGEGFSAVVVTHCNYAGASGVVLAEVPEVRAQDTSEAGVLSPLLCG